jgi:hypothetical protein
MRTIIENWQGTDAELLVDLNTKRHKVVIGDGMVTLAMIAAVDAKLSALLGFRVEQFIALMPISTEQEVADKRQVEKFLFRLEGSDLGLDFNNDSVRGQFGYIMQRTGFSQTEIDTVLGVGAVYKSDADLSLGRDATQDDVDAVRGAIVIENLQAKSTNAAALFFSRVEQQGPWDDATAASEWVKAWGDV